MRAVVPALLAAAVASAGVLAGGCKTAAKGPPRADPRERCRRDYGACAPPAPWKPDTDVAKLPVHDLVHLASRLDVGALSARAARRLHKIAREASEPQLLEIEAALDDADGVLGKCRCEEVPAEIDRSGVREIVRSHVTPKLMRNPGTWAEWILTRLALIRDLSRRSASGAARGEVVDADRTTATIQEAEKDLCDTVHGARSMLSAESFEGMLQAVVKRRESEAGAGSAEAARRIVGTYARAEACEPLPTLGAN
jgi:hypothetical protein